ncbi:MAG TPA: ribosome-associated translation inhibitor RaiA [Bacteroidetes bacterium]|nr:ribosome-associated translation inhibitor RaiA [Bacteroidota bacterium]
MNIQIHSVRFDADKKLLNFIQQKIKKLEQYNDRIIGAEVFLRLDNSQNDENKIAEIRLDIPPSPLFAKKQSKTFEEAADGVVDALKRQITKQKEKLRGV